MNCSVHPRDGMPVIEAGKIDTRAKCNFILHLVARAHGVDARALQAATRQRAPVALARQTAMYLAHVSCGLTQSETGRGFGRDRTTVAHACERTEDRRDAADTDLALDCLEAAIVEWFAALKSRTEAADQQGRA